MEKLWGVGDKTAEALLKLGIETIGELAGHPVNMLKRYFGINGEHLQKIAQGESASSVVPVHKREDEKSMGHEHTFSIDVNAPDVVIKMLLKVSQKVGRRLRRGGFSGKTVTVKLRFSDFETHTHRVSLPFLTYDDREIYETGKLLFEQMFQGNKTVRLIGISVSHLVPINLTVGCPVYQTDLFHESNKKKVILPVMDGLRNKFGENIISRCAAVSVFPFFS